MKTGTRKKPKFDEGRIREIEANCPEGYALSRGQVIDMLGATELWRIFEHHAEPELFRIPQDFVSNGWSKQPKPVPKEWGRCLYCKVV